MQSHAHRAKIVIADDLPIVADALCLSLSRWYEVVGVVSQLSHLAVELGHKATDVAILESFFGFERSFGVLSELARGHPRVRFIILTMRADRTLAEAAIRAGASGYALKSAAPAELRVGVDEVLAGRTYMSPTMKARLVTNPLGADSKRPVFSAKQHKILDLLYTGNTSITIGAIIGISSRTVDYHVDKMCGLVGVISRAQLVRWVEERRHDPPGNAEDTRVP